MKILTLFFFFIAISLQSNNIIESSTNISSSNIENNNMFSVVVQILNVSVEQSVKSASSKNGIYSNPRIKISFPKATNNIKSKLIALGLKKQIDEFEYKMNATAEKASNDALDIFLREIKSLKVSNLKMIIEGDKDEATQYLKKIVMYICMIVLYQLLLKN